jgi:FlaA1/EpsC-like NDP-sugar epimerase
MASFLKGKRIMVTGGTGSFGHQIVGQLAPFSPESIVIFSRDEDKQYRMAQEFDGNAGLEYVIGDVRDFERVSEAMAGVDVVFHAAALKHVPSCESHPLEAVKTNILGAHNVAKAAIAAGVDRVVGVSTDKAVKPVNAMGMSKAMQEKVFISMNSPHWKTRFMCVRYGNVVGSRGSVIPFFKKLLDEKKPLPITDARMTRFLLPLPDAIKLVFKAMEEGKGGEIFVKKMSACRITQLAEVMGKAVTGKAGYPTKMVGIRPGEKIHEVLVSEEEMYRAVEQKEEFVIPPHKEGSAYKGNANEIREYASNNTHMLSDSELLALLKATKWV